MMTIRFWSDTFPIWISYLNFALGTTSNAWEWSVIVKSYQKAYKAVVKHVLIDSY